MTQKFQRKVANWPKRPPKMGPSTGPMMESDDDDQLQELFLTKVHGILTSKRSNGCVRNKYLGSAEREHARMTHRKRTALGHLQIGPSASTRGSSDQHRATHVRCRTSNMSLIWAPALVKGADPNVPDRKRHTSRVSTFSARAHPIWKSTKGAKVNKNGRFRPYISLKGAQIYFHWVSRLDWLQGEPRN
jgi:hypothetical protein